MIMTTIVIIFIITTISDNKKLKNKNKTIFTALTKVEKY